MPQLAAATLAFSLNAEISAFGSEMTPTSRSKRIVRCKDIECHREFTTSRHMSSALRS